MAKPTGRPQGNPNFVPGAPSGNRWGAAFHRMRARALYREALQDFARELGVEELVDMSDDLPAPRILRGHDVELAQDLVFAAARAEGRALRARDAARTANDAPTPRCPTCAHDFDDPPP
jgi:hypothetical protein